MAKYKDMREKKNWGARKTKTQQEQSSSLAATEIHTPHLTGNCLVHRDSAGAHI